MRIMFKITRTTEDYSSGIKAMVLSAGLDFGRILCAVNAELGKCQVDKVSEPKAGKGNVKGKREPIYSITVSQSERQIGDGDSFPLAFDAWCGRIAGAEKLASFEPPIPRRFADWLGKFKVAPVVPVVPVAPVVPEMVPS